MKRLIIIVLLLSPVACCLLPVACSLSPISTASAAPLTPQQKAAKKRAKAKAKAAKQRAKAKSKSSTHRFIGSPNNLIAWGEVGYSALFSTVDQHQTKGGVGGGAGIGYELDYNRWLFLAGVEFTYLSSTTAFPNYSVEAPYLYMPATSKMTYTRDYSQIKYMDQAGLLQLPLRFGYRFTENWYGLLGADLGMSVLGKSRYSYNEYVYARDEQFAEEFHNVGHGTGSNDYTNEVSYSLGCTISPAVEVGYFFNENVRLGLFAEYGVVLGEKAGPIQCKSDLLIGARVTGRLNLPKRVKPKQEPQPKPQPKPQLQPQPQPQPKPEPQQVIEPMKEPIILANLLFVLDRADIIPESTAALDQLLALLQAHPDMKILIIGHTDIRGSEAYNQRLSEQRAKAVKDYLVSHGIEADRLQYEGRGATEPIDTNDTEEGRQRNRRVEFVVR